MTISALKEIEMQFCQILRLCAVLMTKADKKVVILQHYPIVPPSKKETHYTYKADEYLRLLSEYNNVKAVVAGHFNENNEQVVNGVLHISTKEAPKYRCFFVAIVSIVECNHIIK